MGKTHGKRTEPLPHPEGVPETTMIDELPRIHPIDFRRPLARFKPRRASPQIFLIVFNAISLEKLQVLFLERTLAVMLDLLRYVFLDRGDL